MSAIVGPIVRRLRAPLRVAVLGRAGVGRRTVAAALSAAGTAVTDDPASAQLRAVVVAETLKPEDRALIAAGGQPTLVVLNKADLAGFGEGGPIAAARRRAARLRALTGEPTVPMVALLATADVDDELGAALRVLVRTPADLTSTDSFLSGDHPLPVEVRRRLLAALDRYGIAHALLALASGTDPDLPALLRRLSLLDEVLAALHAVGAPVRYRRLQRALTELRALAARTRDDELAALLAADDTVLAEMTAAVEVVEAAGLRVDRADDPAAHLRRARHWRRYRDGPVTPLHRSCAAAICRGSLRLHARPR
ncbi:hypothetical protein C731_0198 [Mycolicibacterium hassiacum DSM 44199]|jgi:hypothetical protein|uniref:Uncharacterized protein n=1 Tax=Mycolicibacterium hassiacum (strain DSM 44199 / CIP 105218 / JCM 12690 / 3849) TaxID=1122247 RepID=K5BI71_MYCHD|nr:hypothetical protein [Mycolicibacterium hassiacum]EKF25811.1 hypothetical protein C731_0198 [Mycolicibacterium hassiacum DSM 44199]MDA4086754.1 hypothetical protein [Mycolicibacterium hassiacum DSM 44199]VCT92277.1 hypothetical protein MHAS_04004 [Mycolicibacterium hassiacum DSM 44199]